MTLAALISAVRDADDGSGLAGLLPVAGRSLVERQARLAVAAGAEHVVLLVERIPGALTGAIDRLRRDGIAVEVARSAGDAADRFHPDERVLVFGDGALAGPDAIMRLVGGPAPALLTLGEAGPAGPFERIDAVTRWAGLALVSGQLLRKTVQMLGDWDLHSTLLRRAVGASARRVDVADGAGLGDAYPPMLVRSRAGARAATQAGIARPREGAGWPDRFLYGPCARMLVGLVLDRAVESRWLRWGGIAMTVAAAPMLGRGWLLAGLVLLMGGALVETTGRALAALRLSPASAGDMLASGRSGAIGIGLLALAWHRGAHDPTAFLVAIALIAVVLATIREQSLLRLAAGRRLPVWLADPDALVLLFAPLALAGLSGVGLMVDTVYAAASFAFVQSALSRRLETAGEERR